MENLVDQFREQVSIILLVQENLLNIDNEENRVEKIIEFVDKNPQFTQDQILFLSFIQSISSSMTSRPLFEKQYVEIIQHYLPRIPKKIIFSFLSKSNMSLALFIDRKVIDINDIEKNCNSINHNSLIYFKDYIKNAKSSSILTELITKSDESKEKENQIAKFIREDDVKNFQIVVNEYNEFKYNTKVPWSIFECMLFLNEKEMPTYTEYACFFGAIKIFKYMVLNGVLATNDDEYLSKLGEFAVIGGNYDIIHILEDHGLKFTEKSLLNSIKFHRNEISIYLNETIGIQQEFIDILMSVESNNLSYFIDNFVVVNNQKKFTEIEFQKLWFVAAENGRFEIIKFLSNKEFEFDRNIKNENGQNILHIAVSNGFLNIVEFLFKQKIIDLNNRDEFVFFFKFMEFKLIYFLSYYT